MDYKQILATLNKIKLKKEGVATLQAFLIFFFGSVENLIRHGYGIVTGFILLAVVILGNHFGREGVAYVAVVTPPLAFAATALLWAILTVQHSHHESWRRIYWCASHQLPQWLILGALYGWYNFLHLRAQTARLCRPRPRLNN
jgi:hypothetical protein